MQYFRRIISRASGETRILLYGKFVHARCFIEILLKKRMDRRSRNSLFTGYLSATTELSEACGIKATLLVDSACLSANHSRLSCNSTYKASPRTFISRGLRRPPVIACDKLMTRHASCMESFPDGAKKDAFCRSRRVPG